MTEQVPTVVVTGLGMITPLGQGLEPTWKALCEGRSGVRPITRFDASAFPVTFGAEVTDPEIHEDDGSWPELDTLKGRLAWFAVKEALQMAGRWEGPCAGDATSAAWAARTGICMGSEAARPDLGLIAGRLHGNQLPTLAELKLLAPDSPTRLIGRMIGAEGPRSTISTACTSSAQAVGEGMLRIRRGEADTMVVGGVDVLVDPIMLTGFSLLGALSTRNAEPQRASRPFDAERNGFVLGEGAGVLILESLEKAQARGAQILGVMSGYGCSCNAYRITDSPPDGRGAALSMLAAIQDAGVQPEEIGYVNAHGTSTQMNDVSEARGIKVVFADATSTVPVGSTKSMMGHLVAACGAVEVITSLLALRHGRLPPTINLEEPDPECEICLIGPEGGSTDKHHALSNAFGFGGSNASIVVSHPRVLGVQK